MSDKKIIPAPKTNEQRPIEKQGGGTLISNRDTPQGGFSRGHKEETSSTGPKRDSGKSK